MVDAAYKDFENLIHKLEGLLRTQACSERREAFHVNEHYGDLSPLTFYSVFLGKDLVRQATGQIALDLCQFFMEREGSLLSGILK